MTASPTSVAATSEIDPPSSPPAPAGKSFVSHAGSDDEDGAEPTQESTDKPSRGRGKGSQGKDANQHQIGKIRHLKKEDGEPLWRTDIQYDFLRAIFDNEQCVFTNSYDKTVPKQNFADLYIDTMARSSKTSKVLRDKLLSDRDAAKGMAMVCLLVNMGRMNTTLNFFPEMRAQLRTYHAIPSLQAHQDAHAYKQLQDAPRLKSILKGGAEDRTEPSTLDQIKGIDVPRTNPVNMIFVICHAAQKIAELHFPNGQEFHDLIMKTQCTSQSRAMAFLWIIWFYLESDFTEEGCEENPFGSGVDYGVGVANQGVPRLVDMTEEEIQLENVDTEAEKEFGREKQQTRAKILEMDQAYMTERDAKRKARQTLVDEGGPAFLPRIRPKHDSDMDSTRSTPPPKGGRGGARRGGNLKYQVFEGSSPARGQDGSISRKPRPPTAHQLAVERNRNLRVEYILDRGMRKQHSRARRARKREGAIVRAYKRLQAMSDTFEDSDDDEILQHAVEGEEKMVAVYREPGMGGIRVLRAEPDNYGEEANAYAAALRRSTRRLGRWTGKEGVIAPVRKHTVAKVAVQAEPEMIEEQDDEDDDLDINGDVTMNDVDLDGERTILADDELDQTALNEDEDEDEDEDDDDEEDQDADRAEAMGDSDGE